MSRVRVPEAASRRRRYSEAALVLGLCVPGGQFAQMEKQLRLDRLRAISRDRTWILVVELKRGRASDAVVGQIQLYMGFVHEALLDPGYTVGGIIALG